MTEPQRLDKRVAELLGCSRTEAERYVEGGWVSVDGRVVEQPQHKVTDEAVTVDPAAKPGPAEPATLLVHKPAGVEPSPDALGALVVPDARWPEDPSGERLLQRHFKRLVPLMPLERDASGLVVMSQDERVQRRLTDGLVDLEQEFLVEISGEMAPYGLPRLSHGLSYRGRRLPPAKVSWQNETRLRFATKAVQPGQLRDLCQQVGLEVVAIRRLRIGSVPLGKMPPGAWRYLTPGVRF